MREAGAAIASTLDRSRAVARVLSFLSNTVPYETATVQVLEEDALEVVGILTLSARRRRDTTAVPNGR